MSSTDDFNPTLSTELVLSYLYQAQADLKILESWLATESQPVIQLDLLFAFETLHARLDTFTASTARH